MAPAKIEIVRLGVLRLTPRNRDGAPRRKTQVDLPRDCATEVRLKAEQVVRESSAESRSALRTFRTTVLTLVSMSMKTSRPHNRSTISSRVTSLPRRFTRSISSSIAGVRP
jgi:hypothetical protein